MGFMNTFKNRLGNTLGNKFADKAADKICGSSTSSCSTLTYSSSQPRHDAAHEAKVDQMRKNNELRALEMQDRMMSSAERLMESSAGAMEEAQKLAAAENRKKGNKN